ncbi:MAG: hypothetical protein IJA14_01425, partial [Alphaproteobacteria bacterium]|nr:hypothetical protein [Alphaproteobacteria bacterium]
FPFTIAKERGEKLIGELLIFSGADVRNEVASTQRRQNPSGNKPVVWRKDVDSFLPGFMDAINPSIRKDKNEEKIFEEFVNDVIENQISVDIRDKNGNTLLLVALQKGWGEIAELLYLQEQI